MARGDDNKLSQMGADFGEGFSSGTQGAVSALGVVMTHSNPLGVKRLGSTIGLWTVFLGTGLMAIWGLTAAGGFISGMVNPRPLPNNAALSARFGHSLGRGIGIVGIGSVNSFASTVDGGIRAQYVSNQQAPSFGINSPNGLFQRVDSVPLMPVGHGYGYGVYTPQPTWTNYGGN